MSYFEHPYCSNSALSALGAELGILPEIKGDSYNNFRMGSLFDAVVTEPAKLDLITNRILDTDYSFTTDEYKRCLMMKRELEKNSLYQVYISANPDFQKEVYVDNFSFGDFELNMKAKLDYFVPGTVADLKSTDSSSQEQFENACEMFGYHRQMWLYCNLTDCDKAILFGVSKKRPHNVFTVIIKKGDDRWKLGEEQIKELAFKFKLLKL